MNVWFGTLRTDPDGGLGSSGIYHASFDAAEGRLAEARLAASIDRPGFLALHPDGRTLYAAALRDGAAVIAAYRIGTQGGLTPLNETAIEDRAAHLAVHPGGRLLVAAQYHAGRIAVLPIDEDGRPRPMTQRHRHGEGTRVHPERQAAAHPHWAGFDPGGRFAFVPDLGRDEVVIYAADPAAGTLTPVGAAACPPGSGPRHMTFAGCHAYVLNELAVSVSCFRCDESGTLAPLATVPALSEEECAKATGVAASEIRAGAGGRFIYTGNRGHDSITVFRRDPASGALERVAVEPVHAAEPRNFALDPAGRWLIAAGQNSNSVNVFSVDPDRGTLVFQRGSDIAVPRPICVLFEP